MRNHGYLYLKIIIILFLAGPMMGRAELIQDISFFQSVLGNLNNVPQAYKCGENTSEELRCSSLFNLFERDRSTGMFFGMISDSPWDACKKQIPSSKEITLNELEKKLSESSQLGLGLRNNFFSSQIDGCLPKKYKRNDRDIDAQKNAIISLGYDYLNRIKKSTSQFADEIKIINSIVGDPIDKDLPCGEFSMPLDAKICQDIKVQKCAPLNELNIYTDTLLENAIAPFIALKSSYKNLSDNFGKTRTLKKSSNQEILKDLLNKMTSIENQFPILKGKTLKPFLNAEALSGNIPTTQKYQAVIKTQLLENRAHLSKKLNENIDMNNCLLYGEDSHCKKFKDHFERIPPSQSVSFFDKDNSANKSIRLKNYAASEIYSNNQCLDNFRGLKNEFNSFATDFSINFGLTLFSGGTSLLLKAGGQGVKLAMAAQKAMLLTDAAFLAHGVDEAIVTCSKELNILESISQPKPKPKSKDEKSNQLNICPTSLATPEHTVVANYQGCITGAMMASLNALPFVPTVVLKYLSRVKVQKNNLETTSSLGSLLKFKTPKKNFDPHDLKSAGSILPAGKTQDPKAIFNRDGVYVYIIDDKGNMVLSHRTPNLNAGTKEGDQFLATHRGLFNTLSEKSSDISIIAAGEIRVIGGVPVRVSPRAGSFHSTPEEVLANMRQTLSTEEKLMIDNLLKEYGSFSKADRSNSLMVEMHMEDFLDLNPKTKVIFEKMQKQMNDLTDKRLASAKEAMESRDLIPSKIDTKFVREVSGDAHIEGRAAAIAEIDCHKSKSCAEQIEMYHNVAKKFMEKFKGPEQCESAVVAKLVIKDLKGLSQKERAFQFYSQRSYLLFKEGPIEFIKNGKPSSFGITEQEAIKYLDEWSRGF